MIRLKVDRIPKIGIWISKLSEKRSDKHPGSKIFKKIRIPDPGIMIRPTSRTDSEWRGDLSLAEGWMDGCALKYQRTDFWSFFTFMIKLTLTCLALQSYIIRHVPFLKFRGF